MSTRHVSVVLLFVTLVVSVLAVGDIPLLFARGTENGDLCWPGEYIENPPDITQFPPKNTNPTSYTETTVERKEHTDGACETDATCIPLYVTCATKSSLELFGTVDGLNRVIQKTYKQEFVRDSLGGYNPRPQYLDVATSGIWGWYYMCTDNFRDGWE